MSALLAGLVDDAGLFPPTALPMVEAIARHRRDLESGEPMLAHRFLCPATRIDELRSTLGPDDRISLGLIASDDGALTAAAAVVDADPRLRPALIEITVDPGDLETSLRAATAYGVPVFVEVRDRSDSPRLASAIARHDAGLKIRCGGVRSDLFPTPAEVADALTAAASAGVPVKATAGMHHAVRHRDPDTGFVHHGYLNLVIGAARAAQGASTADVADALSITDGTALAAEASALEPDAAAAARRLLTSYGSCSTATPPAEAAELGLAPSASALPLSEGTRS